MDKQLKNMIATEAVKIYFDCNVTANQAIELAKEAYGYNETKITSPK